MRSLVSVLLSLFVMSALSAAATVDANEIQKILKDAVETKRTVGIVVGIVDASGSHIYSCGKTARDGRDVDGDSVFEIGSVTKTFTATLLADMVKRGEVSLDDPVVKYLPKDAKVPSRGGKEITLLDLVTHRSGLPRMPTNFAPADPENSRADYTAKKMYEFLASYTLPRDIGASFEYSNIGVSLLGEALARRAGKSYEALLSERIFRPLNMSSTCIVLRPELSSRQATGHSAELKPVKNWDFDVFAGAGGIRSTAADMLKYLSAYMGSKPSPLTGAMAMACQDLRDTDVPNLRIGFAWHVLKLSDSQFVMHNGETGGYHSFLGFDMKKGLGVVILSNSKNDIDLIGLNILKDRKEISLDAGLLDACVGRYQLTPSNVLTVTREANLLFLQATGGPRLQLHAEAETEFFLMDMDVQVSFVKDALGKVTQLVLHGGGQDMKADRIK
ncbi:MAG TPA: serine hydrolase [Acidobacteriota bacterium]